MSKDPISQEDQDVSRRGLLEKAAVAVATATSLVAARTALARSSDVVMDSAGRVLIHGAALPPQRPEGSFDTAAANNDTCTNDYTCTSGSNKGCSNAKNCVAPSRGMQPAGGAKLNAPAGGMGAKGNAPSGGMGPKVDAPGSGGSHSSGGGSRK
jgi:hypothetical protein